MSFPTNSELVSPRRPFLLRWPKILANMRPPLCSCVTWSFSCLGPRLPTSFLLETHSPPAVHDTAPSWFSSLSDSYLATSCWLILLSFTSQFSKCSDSILDLLLVSLYNLPIESHRVLRPVPDSPNFISFSDTPWSAICIWPTYLTQTCCPKVISSCLHLYK